MIGSSTQLWSLSRKEHPSVSTPVKQWHPQPVISPLLVKYANRRVNRGQNGAADQDKQVAEEPNRQLEHHDTKMPSPPSLTSLHSSLHFPFVGCPPFFFHQIHPVPSHPPSLSHSPLSLWRCSVFRFGSNLQIGWSNNGCKRVWESKFWCIEPRVATNMPPVHVKLHDVYASEFAWVFEHDRNTHVDAP